MKETKQDLAQQIVDLQTLLETAKDNWIEGHKTDAHKLLQRAAREIGQMIWRVTPTGETV